MSTETLIVSDPDAAEIETVAASRTFFGHQSVGANVLMGIAAVAPGIRMVQTSTPPAPDDAGVLAHAAVGTNGDPQSKLDAFVEIMDGGMAEAVDVAMLKFCYVDVSAATDVDALLDTYIATMEELQAKHPDVRILHATVPLVTDRDLRGLIRAMLGRDEGMGPADNIARHRFNEGLRERLGRFGDLFDIAAVEAAMDQSPTLRRVGDDEFYVLHRSFASDPGHLNEFGARAVAAELIHVIAQEGARS